MPNSPWFLVAKMDISEVYTPLREKLWGIVILIGALLICAGAGTGFVWRRQRLRYYREKYEAAESLRESEESPKHVRGGNNRNHPQGDLSHRIMAASESI